VSIGRVPVAAAWHTGDRPRRDHRHHPRATRADDPGQRWTLALAHAL